MVNLGQTPEQDRAYILPLSSEFPDPANELARYADTLDPRTRKASGIVVILGQTPDQDRAYRVDPVSYTHLRAHETVLDLVCRLLLEKKKNTLLTNHHAILICIVH